MADDHANPNSFSAGQRWGIWFSVMLSILAVVSLVGMLNYLAARHHWRTTWSVRTRAPLARMTLGVINSISNEVKVTIYFKRSDPLFDESRDLLNEYRQKNPLITVETVDYERDAGASIKLKAAYPDLLAGNARDLVIFDGGSNRQPIPVFDSWLWDKDRLQQLPDGSWDRKIKGFRGETYFTAALLMAAHPQPKIAAYLDGHGEHHLTSQEDEGYSKFRNILYGSGINTSIINLEGTNTVPTNCDALIVAGPRRPLPPEETGKIDKYLAQGGRLLVLFNNQNAALNTGLEAMLANWGIIVGTNFYVEDVNNTAGNVMLVREFATNHPASRSLVGGRLGVASPRPVAPLPEKDRSGGDSLRVQVLAQSGRGSMLQPGSHPGPIPLIVAAQKPNLRGGESRIVVAGDSRFLDNQVIDSQDWQNGEFARLAMSWLLDQPAYMQEIGPRAMPDYRFVMSRADQIKIMWIFLAAVPGGILLLGGLVWLRRRR